MSPAVKKGVGLYLELTSGWRKVKLLSFTRHGKTYNAAMVKTSAITKVIMTLQQTAYSKHKMN